jgi:hypothetical protein
MCSQRLHISADFVADISCARCAVAADDAQVNETMLHQMTASIIGDNCVWDRLAEKLKRG